MPVTFEQPDPVGFLSGPAQAGGYVHQYDADRQFALQAAALQQHTQLANAQLQQQRLAQQNQLAMQGAALSRQGQVTPAMQFQAREQQAQMGQQSQVQDQRFQQQLALQRNQFTQADQIQLAKLKQADSFVDQQAGINGWSPEEIAQAKSHIRGVMGPLEMKEAQAKVMMQQAQTQQFAHGHSMQAASQVEAGKLVAKHFGGDGNDLTFPFTYGNGQAGVGHINPTDLKPMYPPAGSRGGAKEEQDDTLTDKEYMDHYEKIAKAVDDRLLQAAGKDELGHQRAPDVSTRREAINQDLKDAGLAMNLGEHRAKRSGTKAGVAAEPGAKPEATGLIPPMDDPQKEADAYQAIYSDKPIPPNVKARLRQLKAAVDARKGMVQAPGETVAQPATRQPPEQSWGQWAAGMLPRGGNVGVSGGNPQYR